MHTFIWFGPCFSSQTNFASCNGRPLLFVLVDSSISCSAEKISLYCLYHLLLIILNLISPTYLSEAFSYDGNRRGTTPLSEFATDVENGSVKSVCVRSTPDGQLEDSCEAELNQYTTTQRVTCTGFGPAAFQPYLAGTCQAVWEEYSPISYFRQYDLYLTENQEMPPSRKTSLEIATTHVFHSLIYDLTWEGTLY